jgi:hypothetical protein
VAGAVHRRRLLQVHQVVMGLAHPRLLALVPPAEEQLGALLEEASCVPKEGRIWLMVTLAERGRLERQPTASPSSKGCSHPRGNGCLLFGAVFM